MPSRALLASLPGDQRRHLPHPRRERRRGGQLPVLEDRLRRRERSAAARSRSTCTPRASTRRMIDLAARHRHARQGLAQVLGRAPRHALSPGRYSRVRRCPSPATTTRGLMTLSAGSRSFPRYGYGDLLREDRRCDILHRIWPGTQRLLLWGDPRDRRRLLARLPLLRQRRRRDHGAALLQRPPRLRHRGRPLRLRRRVSAPALGLGEIPLHLSRLGPRCSTIPMPKVDVDPSLAAASRILPIVTTAHCLRPATTTIGPRSTPTSPWSSRRNPLTPTARRPRSSATSARSIRSSSPASTISPTSY